jgi:hypothetical protein
LCRFNSAENWRGVIRRNCSSVIRRSYKAVDRICNQRRWFVSSGPSGGGAVLILGWLRFGHALGPCVEHHGPNFPNVLPVDERFGNKDFEPFYLRMDKHTQQRSYIPTSEALDIIGKYVIAHPPDLGEKKPEPKRKSRSAGKSSSRPNEDEINVEDTY